MQHEGPLAPQARLILAIDQLDRAILRLSTQREELRAQVKASKAEVEDLEQQLATLQTRLQDMANAQEIQEAELRKVDQKIKKLSAFEDVSTAREYDAARRELEALMSTKGRLEEDILNRIEAQELGTQEEASIKANILGHKRIHSDRVKVLKPRFEALGEELELTRKDRDSLLPQLLPELRERYDRNLNKYKDRAMATVANDRCPHCQLTVPPQHIVDFLMGRLIPTCQHCGRFLLPPDAVSN